jgi:hypothetical protein
MDLLSAIFNAVGDLSSQLVAHSDLIQTLLDLVKFKDNQVRQYAFGLLGDMIKCTGTLLNPVLGNFLMIAIDHLQYNEQMPTTLTVCNNSCWFIGQVCASQNTRIAL